MITFTTQQTKVQAKMLNENHIVDLLTAYLKKNDYEIVQSLDTKSKGVDIIADNKITKHRLFVEVKGETSSKEHTNRFGKPFDGKQIRNHIARAILASMKIISAKPAGNKTRVAIAFPLNDSHQKEMETVKVAVKQLEIKIFWVNEKKVIEE